MIGLYLNITFKHYSRPSGVGGGGGGYSVIGGTMVLTVLWAQSRQSETDRELSETETETVRVYEKGEVKIKIKRMYSLLG